MPTVNKTYYHNIDLDNNQLINAVIENRTTAPTSPVDGQIYYNTVDKKIYYYNSTTVAWGGIGSSAATIYTDNGTLLADRIVTGNGFTLTLNPNTNLAGSLFGNTLRTRNNFSSSYTQNGTVFANTDLTFDGTTSGQNNTLFMGQQQITNTGTGSTIVYGQAFDVEQHLRAQSSSARLSAQNYILQYRGYPTDISTNSLNQITGWYIINGHRVNGTTTNIVTGTVRGWFNILSNWGGTINNATGVGTFGDFGSSTGTVQNSVTTNYYAFESRSTIGTSQAGRSHTVTNYYGLFLNTPTVNANGSITNRWGVYAPDVAMKHYLNGTVLIGSATDSTFGKLQVTGAIQQSSVISSILKTDSNGVLVAAAAGTDYQAPITLTVTGNSGFSTFIANTLNVPTYTLSGLGGVPTTRQLTINGTSYDLSADRSWNVGTVTSIGVSMPSAFAVASSPVTTSGTIAITGAGLASQYVRGDGALGDFPASGGGGSSVSYYLNGSVNQGIFGGSTYYELNRTPVIGGPGTNFSITNTVGLISQFITDPLDPGLLLIPAGNWAIEFFVNASDSLDDPYFYVELYLYNGVTFTLIASGVTNPEYITNGTSVDVYYTAIAVSETIITVNDRIAIRVYGDTDGNRTITLHTEANNLSQIITTFANGLTAINGLTRQVQYLATSTTGTDFTISSLVDTHTFNIPSSSAINRGLLTPTDWTTFNNKVGGTGSAGQVAYWNGTGSQTGSSTFLWNAASSLLRINGGIGVNRDAFGGRALDVTGGGIRLTGSTNGTFEVNGSNSSGSVSTIGGVAGINITDTSNARLSITGNSYNYEIQANADLLKIRDITVGNIDRFIVHKTGNVAIGSSLTDTGQRLQVNGDAFIKGSGATSATNGLVVQNSASTELVRVDNSGQAFFSNRIAVNRIQVTSTANQLELVGGIGGATGGTGIQLGQFTNATNTSGTFDRVLAAGSFLPTSGTGLFNGIQISATINQTGGANGITRGLYVNPTLTAAADWRSIETTNNSGYAIYAGGTASSYFGGIVGIGGLPTAGYTLRVYGNIWATGFDQLSVLAGSSGVGSITFYDQGTLSMNLYGGHASEAVKGFFTIKSQDISYTSATSILLHADADFLDHPTMIIRSRNTSANSIYFQNYHYSLGALFTTLQPSGGNTDMTFRPNRTNRVIISDSSVAALSVESTTQGFRPPRMTSTQRTAISSPAVGLIVYQTDGTEGTYEYVSTGWRIINAAAGGGSGTVTSVSVVSANGFAGTVATASSTPAITLTTTITGILKGNGTAISAAVAGTDYQGVSTNLTSLAGLTYASTSFVKMTAAGTFALDTNIYYLASNPSGYTANTGTVTTVSVTTANGVSGSVATAGTTPAITLTLGAITPTSVNSVVISGSTTPTLAVTGTSSISGSNTGDNATNTLYSGLVSNATHTGDATGATSLTVVGLRGVALPTLGATAGFLKYTGTGTNTWVFDTNTYITGNQSISVTGDASGSGTTAITLTLATVNSNTGTFNNVTVNGKGLVTAASNVSYLTANQSITLSGDISGTGATAITTTIGANKVTNAMLAQVATATFKGRTTAATGNVEDLTSTQATALLDVFSSTLKGLVPLSGGGTTNFLRADGTWAAPGGVGGGTVTTVSIVSANGFAGTVANATSTPAITISTTITGLLKGNGTAISAAVANTDYLSVDDPLYTGTLATGSLSFGPQAANPLLALESSVNSYNQSLIQNSSAGTQASSDIIVNNDQSTDTTFYGDYGINSSNYTGQGSLNLANAVYLYSAGSDLVLGTITDNSIHFVINGSTVDAAIIKTTKQLQLPSYTTSSSFTGTAVGFLAFDASGNIITQGVPIENKYTVINVTATHNETATSGTKVIKADTTSGAFSINLPTAVGNGATIIIKKTSGTAALTVDASGSQTIDGGLTAVINKVYESITIVSDNANWQII
jgi:hypothetical protein